MAAGPCTSTIMARERLGDPAMCSRVFPQVRGYVFRVFPMCSLCVPAMCSDTYTFASIAGQGAT